jgi:hypothetical protein
MQKVKTIYKNQATLNQHTVQMVDSSLMKMTKTMINDV